FLVRCFITPPPPRSTLFPYTTLFRSGAQGEADDPLQLRQRLLGVDDLDRGHPHGPGRFQVHAQVVEEHRLDRLDAQLVTDEPVEDRKSTRLNSSHVKISYAVFCLKKK